ncbi:hypothetical protein HY524_00175 [Candidatus Berkelbacteria bacterium]|nr:hypothetical protein [Candidatus Berkelbacteria bacterium]
MTTSFERVPQPPVQSLVPSSAGIVERAPVGYEAQRAVVRQAGESGVIDRSTLVTFARSRSALVPSQPQITPVDRGVTESEPVCDDEDLGPQETAFLEFSPLVIWLYNEFFRREITTVDREQGYAQFVMTVPNAFTHNFGGLQKFSISVPSGLEVKLTRECVDAGITMNVHFPTLSAYATFEEIAVRVGANGPLKTYDQEAIRAMGSLVQFTINPSWIPNGVSTDVAVTFKVNGHGTRMKDITVRYILSAETAAVWAARAETDQVMKQGRLLEKFETRPAGQEHTERKDSTSQVMLTVPNSSQSVSIKVLDGVTADPIAFQGQLQPNQSYTIKVKENSSVQLIDAEFTDSNNDGQDDEVLVVGQTAAQNLNPTNFTVAPNTTVGFTVKTKRVLTIQNNASQAQGPVAGLFDRTAGDRWSQLEGLVAQADTVVADVPALNSAEKTKRNVKWTDYGKTWGKSPDLGRIGSGDTVDKATLAQKLEQRAEGGDRGLAAVRNRVARLFRSNTIAQGYLTQIATTNNVTETVVIERIAQTLHTQVLAQTGQLVTIPAKTKFYVVTEGKTRDGKTETDFLINTLPMPSSTHQIAVGRYTVLLSFLGRCGNLALVDILSPVTSTPPQPPARPGLVETELSARPPVARPPLVMTEGPYAAPAQSHDILRIPTMPTVVPQANIKINNGNTNTITLSPTNTNSNTNANANFNANSNEQQTQLNNTNVNLNTQLQQNTQQMWNTQQVVSPQSFLDGRGLWESQTPVAETLPPNGVRWLLKQAVNGLNRPQRRAVA